MALTKAIAEENKKLLGTQQAIKDHHYERLEALDKMEKRLKEVNLLQQTLDESGGNVDKLTQTERERIKLSQQLAEFEGKILTTAEKKTKLDLQASINASDQVIMAEKRLRSSEEYYKKQNAIQNQVDDDYEKELQFLKMLDKQLENRESREESVYKVKRDQLTIDIEFLELQYDIRKEFGMQDEAADRMLEKQKKRLENLNKILEREDSLQKRKEDDKRQKELDKAVKEYENKWEAANKKKLPMGCMKA